MINFILFLKNKFFRVKNQLNKNQLNIIQNNNAKTCMLKKNIFKMCDLKIKNIYDPKDQRYSVISKNFLKMHKKKNNNNNNYSFRCDCSIEKKNKKKIFYTTKRFFAKRRTPWDTTGIPSEKHNYLQKQSVLRPIYAELFLYWYTYMLFTSKVYNKNFEILEHMNFSERIQWYRDHEEILWAAKNTICDEYWADFIWLLHYIGLTSVDCFKFCGQIKKAILQLSIDFTYYSIGISKVDFLAFYIEFIPHATTISFSNIPYIKFFFFILFLTFYFYSFYYFIKVCINLKYIEDINTYDYLGILVIDPLLLKGKIFSELQKYLLTDGKTKNPYDENFFIAVFNTINNPPKKIPVVKKSKFFTEYDYTTGLFKYLPGHARPTELFLIKLLTSRILKYGPTKVFHVNFPTTLLMSGDYPNTGINKRTFETDFSIIELKQFSDYVDTERNIIFLRNYFLDLKTKNGLFPAIYFLLKIFIPIMLFYWFILLICIFYLFFIKNTIFFWGKDPISIYILIFLFLFYFLAYLHLVYTFIKIFFFKNKKLMPFAIFLKPLFYFSL